LRALAFSQDGPDIVSERSERVGYLLDEGPGVAFVAVSVVTVVQHIEIGHQDTA